jgi:multidrug transporter EmrE-like cation transporter
MIGSAAGWVYLLIGAPLKIVGVVLIVLGVVGLNLAGTAR